MLTRLCGYEPFYSDNEAVMYRRIIKCDYKFDSPWWDEVSDNAKVHVYIKMDFFLRARCSKIVFFLQA